jgi:hypothetical protein
VIDTIGFEADSSGLGLNVPAGPRKHLVERLTLADDRTRLRYEVTVEDPDFLTGRPRSRSSGITAPTSSSRRTRGPAIRRLRAGIRTTCRRSER